MTSLTALSLAFVVSVSASSPALGQTGAAKPASAAAATTLHQDMRKVRLIQFGALLAGAFAENTHPGQTRQLNRKGANADQNDAKGKLKELGKTVHGDRSGPHKARFLRPATGRLARFWTFAQ
jgi:hypothetical protein